MHLEKITKSEKDLQRIARRRRNMLLNELFLLFVDSRQRTNKASYHRGESNRLAPLEGLTRIHKHIHLAYLEAKNLSSPCKLEVAPQYSMRCKKAWPSYLDNWICANSFQILHRQRVQDRYYTFCKPHESYFLLWPNGHREIEESHVPN